MRILLRVCILTCLFEYIDCAKDESVPKNNDLQDIPKKFIKAALNLDLLNPLLDSEFNGNLLFNRNINEYWLYTSANPKKGYQLIHGDEKSVKNSNFDKTKNTLFIVHGWFGDYKNNVNTNITNSALSCAYANNINVIRVNWVKFSRNTFVLASCAARKVGRHLAEFINWMTTQGLCCERTQLHGESLGSHIVGIAARKSDCNIKKITVTDAAKPLWENDPERVQKSDAAFLEAIHTSTLFGQYSPLGDADIYVNGGKEMPNCGKDFQCSHLMAGKYFAASMLYPDMYVAKRCDTMDDVEKDTCDGVEASIGGYDLSKTYKGIFRLNTNIQVFPFYANKEDKIK